MARIRSVHPGLASDEAFMSMSMAAKAGWPLLWTECDDAGVFEWKPIVLKARIFPADNVDFASVLAEYEALGCVRRVEADGRSYGVIRNFCKFQRPKHPSYRHPEGAREPDFTGFKAVDSEKAPPVLPPASPRPTEKPPQMKEGIGEVRGEAKASLGVRAHESRDWPKDGFRQFYARYPRKQKPQDAEKAWAKVERVPGLTFELVMAGVERLIASEPEAQFIPYPASWLNAGQWADVIPPKTANGGSHVREGHSVVAAARQMLAHSRQLDERERPALLQIGRH